MEGKDWKWATNLAIRPDTAQALEMSTGLTAMTQTLQMWTQLSHKFNAWMGSHLTAPTLPHDVVFNTDRTLTFFCPLLREKTCAHAFSYMREWITALNYPKTNILEKLPISNIILVHCLYRWSIRTSLELVKPFFFNAHFMFIPLEHVPSVSWWHYPCSFI
jgi:hypothetical protein